jgi:hypothetical protein
MNADARLALIKVKIDRAKKHLRDLEIAKENFINGNPFTLGYWDIGPMKNWATKDLTFGL